MKQEAEVPRERRGGLHLTGNDAIPKTFTYPYRSTSITVLGWFVRRAEDDAHEYGRVLV